MFSNLILRIAKKKEVPEKKSGALMAPVDKSGFRTWLLNNAKVLFSRVQNFKPSRAPA